MTISTTQRQTEQRDILRLMLDGVRDNSMLWDTRIDARSTDFSSFALTSFVELQEQGLVERWKVMGSTQFHLTPDGWLAALRVGEKLEDQELREQAIKLIRFFKAQIKGREVPHDLPVSHHQAVGETGVPFPWILRALDSGLLQALFPADRMTAYWDRSSKIIRVPSTFGMDWIEPGV